MRTPCRCCEAFFFVHLRSGYFNCNTLEQSVIEKIYSLFISGAAICTDTRKIERGCIFFALKGENFNGNQFAPEAIKNGARAAVVDESIREDGSKEQIFLVQDVLECLQQLALHHRKQLSIPFLAITGSNGKTTTKELIHRVLSSKYKTLCTSGNLNNHIGVPLTLLSVNREHEIAVIEMGANHQKEIELLCSLALPTHVLITNVGKAHLEGFGGFEGVKKGKGEMYDFARKNNSIVFINDDNIHLTQMLGVYAKTFRYGKSGDCDVSGIIREQDSYVGLEWQTRESSVIHQLHSRITGSYNFENILSAIATGIFFGVDPSSINMAIENYIPDNQRSQEIQLGNMHVIMDAYNANPTSMQAALANFNRVYRGKKVVFLGEMLELGTDAVTEHEHIVSLLSDYHFDEVVVVGGLFKLPVLPASFVHFESSEQAARYVLQKDFSGFHILIKGSRGSRMEKILAALQSKVTTS